jgi:hypothetical protein
VATVDNKEVSAFRDKRQAGGSNPLAQRKAKLGRHPIRGGDHGRPQDLQTEPFLGGDTISWRPLYGCRVPQAKSLPASAQHTNKHQRCQEIFDGKEALLGSPTPEQTKAVIEASSKLGMFCFTTIPFQPSVRPTVCEVAVACSSPCSCVLLLVNGRPIAPTAVRQTSSGTPGSVSRGSRGVWPVTRLPSALSDRTQALASTPGTRVRLEPLGHQTIRRNNIQVITLLGSEATRLGNAVYDLTVVSVASKDALTTSRPEQDNNPSRRVNKYLDSVADHKVHHRLSINLPFHPIVFSIGGMMNGTNTKVFASWKRVMTRGTYNLMLKQLSLCLLQARVRSFEL